MTVTDGGLDNDLATLVDNGVISRTFTVTVTPVNDPPTLDPIADPAAIIENAGLQTVNLTGHHGRRQRDPAAAGDGDERHAGPDPEPDGHYTSPNATGSLTYTPVAEAFGTAIVTVTVTDGGLDNNLATPGDNGTFTRQFTVIVTGVNDPPTLDAIADPAPIAEDAGPQTVNLTGITAGTGESQLLQVTASSNNTGLIPNPTVTYTSPAATGSLSYTPVANASGSAIITVTVTDGGLDNNLATPGDNGTVSRTFTVVVSADNDPPTLDAIPDPAAILEDAGAQTREPERHHGGRGRNAGADRHRDQQQHRADPESHRDLHVAERDRVAGLHAGRERVRDRDRDGARHRPRRRRHSRRRATPRRSLARSP